MATPTILVTGASGNVGREVATHLISLAKDKNFKIRLGFRDMKKAEMFQKQGVEIVPLDFNNQESLQTALTGVERLWLTAPNPHKDHTPFGRINLIKGFIDMAKKMGVKFIVFGSVLGAEQENGIFAKEFRDAERHIEKSGIPYCFLRMGMFLENVLGMKKMIQEKNCICQPLGTGEYCPISVSDIGLMSTTILMNPEPHKNRAYAVTGCESVSGEKMANSLSKILGRQIKYTDMNRNEAINMWKSQMAEYQAMGLSELFDLIQKGTLRTPSTDFEKVVGKKPILFEDRVSQIRYAIEQPTSA